MRTKQRAAGAIAALALAAGGLVVTATPSASASESSPSAVLNCSYQRLTGNPHKGAAVTCTGGSFTGVVLCKRTDTGLTYRHFGNRVNSGGTSTVWCDVQAEVVSGYGIPS
ncbi:hypothetical protein [Streptomyces cyaneofuscatus]|uniref:hypothetical protein n=1 Tax=Streptomyces cyaneofuscatus TaxID=66883 RepID=UPI0033BFB446